MRVLELTLALAMLASLVGAVEIPSEDFSAVAEKLVKALYEATGLPVHFHTHDTAGIQAAAVLKASEAGVSVADAAIASMSGLTSQPNLNSIVEALRNTPRDAKLNVEALNECSDYWEGVRELYHQVRLGLKSGVRVGAKNERSAPGLERGAGGARYKVSW